MKYTLTYWQRCKIAFQYLLPQQYLTRFAGWFANKEWGKLTHLVIKLFATKYKVNWEETEKNHPSDYKSFNEFFTRPLKSDARPINTNSQSIVFPADGQISEFGDIQKTQLLQAKGHYFNLTALLANQQDLIALFAEGKFITTYLSPRDYHRVHMPCDGTLRKMIYVPGDLFSVNPFLAEHVPYLFARNERVICYFDTPHGPMIQILVGATITASMSTVWHGIVNPPRTNNIQTWDYPSEGENTITLNKGNEMGAFRLGSTVINLFTKDALAFAEDLNVGDTVKMGEAINLSTYATTISSNE